MQQQLGSGKTAVLVERIINKIIKEKIDIDNLLVVTFTNAAASEMRERILSAIYKIIDDENFKDEETISHLQRQITLLNKANICTIDSFCLNVIRNNFFELEISPNFRIADTAEIELQKQETLETLFEEKYEINLQIKAPNDIYYNGKKVGGILTESKIVGQKTKYIVVGIGINTNSKNFSDDIRNIATSIKREFNIDIIATSPSVIYEVILTSGETVMVDNPCNMPDKTKISLIKEPYVKASIFVPSDYIGAIMNLCEDRRGIYKTTEFIDPKRVNIIYELPLAEIVYDFFDKLKSYTKGYASLDYELSDYKVSDLVKMDILINGEVVDALSLIVYKGSAYNRGHAITKALRTLIPRQMFEVPIQASVGSKVISRETISAMRKNVLAKCYGGDVSRKRKLLEKQKEGKKRMKMVGSVEVPPEAFLSILQEGE